MTFATVWRDLKDTVLRERRQTEDTQWGLHRQEPPRTAHQRQEVDSGVPGGEGRGWLGVMGCSGTRRLYGITSAHMPGISDLRVTPGFIL